MTFLSDPEQMIRVHSAAALFWLVLTLATTAWAVISPETKLLVPWLIFMSGYAIVGTHWSAREGAAPSAKEAP